MAAVPLTTNQRAVLVVLVAHDPYGLTAEQIAAETGLRASRVGWAIASLRDRFLIVLRWTDGKDGSPVERRFYPTSIGRKRVARSRGSDRARVARIRSTHRRSGRASNVR